MPVYDQTYQFFKCTNVFVFDYAIMCDDTIMNYSVWVRVQLAHNNF